MTYRIVFAPSASRAMDKLPMAVAAAAYVLITGDLAENPQRVGKPLREPFEGDHSARRGDYRIRYQIGDDIVLVKDVAHRGDVYRSP